MRKMIKGEVLLVTTSRNCFEVINLGDRGKGRCIYKMGTPIPSQSGFSIPIWPKVHPDGSKAYLPNGAAPWMRILDLTMGEYLANPAIVPPSKTMALELSPDNLELCVTFNSDPWFYRYDVATLTIQGAPDVKPTGTGYRPIYSHDGSLLVIPHDTTPFMSIYNRSSMTKLANPPTLPAARCYVGEFSADDSLLAIGGVAATGNGSFNLYNTSDWSRVATPPAAVSGYSVYDIHFSPNGERIGVALSISNPTTLFRYYTIATNTWTNINLGSVADYLQSGGHSFAWLDDDTVALFSGAASNSAACVIIYSFASNSVIDVYGLPFTNTIGASFLPNTRWRRLAGTVVDDVSNPVSRAVRAYDRGTGDIVGETISSAVDGSFEMKVFTTDPVYVLSIGIGTEVTKLFDSILPAPLA